MAGRLLAAGLPVRLRGTMAMTVSFVRFLWDGTVGSSQRGPVRPRPVQGRRGQQWEIRARGRGRGSAGTRRGRGYKPATASAARAARGSRWRWWLQVIRRRACEIVAGRVGLAQLGGSYPLGQEGNPGGGWCHVGTDLRGRQALTWARSPRPDARQPTSVCTAVSSTNSHRPPSA